MFTHPPPPPHFVNDTFEKDKKNVSFPKNAVHIFSDFSKFVKFLIFEKKTSQLRWKINFKQMISFDTYAFYGKFATFEKKSFFEKQIYCLQKPKCRTYFRKLTISVAF